MLVYLFWHSRQPDADRARYEECLRDFHAALAKQPPAGLVESMSYRIDGIPWLEASEGYADWYLLRDSAALDALNDAAVGGECREPHQRVARLAQNGAGGVVKHVMGEQTIRGARFTYWFQKPAGVPYPEFDGSLATLASYGRRTLWRRQMVLGPTTEYAVTSLEPIVVPANLKPIELRQTAV